MTTIPREETPVPEPDRLLSEAQCVAVYELVLRLARGGGGGETEVGIASWWGGELRWGRNRVTLASDRRESVVTITRTIHGAPGRVRTNQLDAAGLEGAVRTAERYARHRTTGPDDLAAPYRASPATGEAAKQPAIWSAATYQLTTEERGRVARALIAPAAAAGLLSAGYLASEAQAYGFCTSPGERFYRTMSQAQCALTVRDAEGTGSGWAGKSSYDWSRIDATALAARALQKCVASRNPVALEPGRYTVILEPQAVADLLTVLMQEGPFSPIHRPGNEGGNPNAFWLKPNYAKLGLKVADERVTIGYDVLDPELGARPYDLLSDFRTRPSTTRPAANWIEQGVLTHLSYSREYALRMLHEDLGLGSPAFRMRGGATSLEEMIATTTRGLLVTRFWDVGRLPGQAQTLLSSGFTRDGLWLIEHGKITKPVKNFRFVDSPLHILNRLEQLGPAEPVFRPGYRAALQPAVVPPLKVRDFHFTALVDAV